MYFIYRSGRSTKSTRSSYPYTDVRLSDKTIATIMQVSRECKFFHSLSISLCIWSVQLYSAHEHSISSVNNHRTGFLLHMDRGVEFGAIVSMSLSKVFTTCNCKKKRWLSATNDFCAVCIAFTCS